MAESERLGASFSIDITSLKTGLAQANRLIKESNSEFKAAAAGLDDWTESEEGLTAKLKNLNDVAEIQAEKVEALQKEYDRCVDNGMDPMSAAAIKMRTNLNNEKAALQNTKSESEKYANKLKELGDESDNSGDSIKDLGKKTEEAGDSFTVAKGAIAGFIANGLTALAGACKDAISSIANLGEETQEYREDMGKLETAFESAGKSTELATETYKKFYQVLGEEDRSVEAVNHLAKLVETEEDMQKWTDIAAGVWGTFGDSLPIEGLTEAANETAKVGDLTGVLADALNWAGVNEDDFQASLDECNNESERASLITETLNGLYSDAAEKYKENNASIMEARAVTSDYTDTMAAFGEKVEPITTKVKEGFNRILEKVLELVEGVDLDALGEKIDGAFDTFVNDILPKIIDGLQWVKDNKDIIIAAIAGIAAGYVAFQAIPAIITAVNTAMAILNGTMALNPFGLVALAIGALVTAIVLLIKNWDSVKEAGVAAWNWIKNAWATASSWFNEKVIQPISKFFTNLWSGIKNAASNAWAGVKNAFSAVGTFFSGMWDTIKEKFTTIGTKVADAIGGAFKSAINAVIGTVENGLNVIPNTVNKAIDAINKLPGVNIGKLSTISLPRLARGGVVSQATNAIVGEDGAEAIVPLENNTEWIDKVADRISEKQKAVVVNQTNNYSQTHSRYEIYKSKQQTAAAVRLALGV